MKKEEFYRDALKCRGPLEDIRAIEATTNMAGPVVGTLLADLGAEVIKVDLPEVGEIGRKSPPFVPCDSEIEASTLYLSINRNKKCITLNLRRPKGQEIFRALAQKMDVVIENFRPGAMDSWRIGYQDIKKLKPDIVYTSVSGYGQFGPYSRRPAYDAVAQAMSGIMYCNGYADGPPTRVGHAIGDTMSGWLGAFSTLAALHYRDKTGEGQQIDISMVDALTYASEIGILCAANLGYIWQRDGSHHPSGAPYNVFRCQDDYIFITIPGLDDWSNLCDLMGREDLKKHPELNSFAGLKKHESLIDGAIAQWVQDKPRDEVYHILNEAGFIVVPILPYDQIIKDAHFQERDMIAKIDHPMAGPLKIYGVAPKFSRTPAQVHTPAPLLGQHNQEVYQGLLGYDQEQLMELKKQGII